MTTVTRGRLVVVCGQSRVLEIGQGEPAPLRAGRAGRIVRAASHRSLAGPVLIGDRIIWGEYGGQIVSTGLNPITGRSVALNVPAWVAEDALGVWCPHHGHQIDARRLRAAIDLHDPRRTSPARCSVDDLAVQF